MLANGASQYADVDCGLCAKAVTKSTKHFLRQMHSPIDYYDIDLMIAKAKILGQEGVVKSKG